MASHLKNLSELKDQLPNANTYKIGIVVSDYYLEINEALLEGCRQLFIQQGADPNNIIVEWAPGTFELPIACHLLNMSSNDFDAIIALGCVVKGETDHDKYINHSVADALQNLAIQYDKPFLFGVLTPNTYQQALDRAGGKHGNKGIEVGAAALKMIAMKKKFRK